MLTRQVDEEAAHEPDLVTAEPVRPARDRDSEPGPLPFGGFIHAVAAGITVAAVLRKGAFFRPDKVLLPALLALLAVIVTRRLHRPARTVLITFGAFGAWWLFAAVGWGVPSRAAVFLASLVGFGAALALGQSLEGRYRHDLHQLLVLLGEGVAVTGLAALVVRYQPWALHIQGPWQLAGTLTYANATGVLLALLLPLAVCLPDGPHRRVAVFLLTCALLGTLSRAGVLALGAAVLFVPRDKLRSAAWPAVTGLAAGGACIATAGRGGTQPLLAVAVLVGLGLTLLPIAGWKGPLAAAGAVAAGGVVLLLVQGPLPALQNRVDSGMNGRPRVWKAALHEFGAHPLVGAGPERDLLARNKGHQERWIYAHNEYLQVAAGTGLAGLALLGFAGMALVRHGRSFDLPSAAARAGLVALAAGGLFDFGWHLPAVGITTGWVASLSLGGT